MIQFEFNLLCILLGGFQKPGPGYGSCTGKVKIFTIKRSFSKIAPLDLKVHLRCTKTKNNGYWSWTKKWNKHFQFEAEILIQPTYSEKNFFSLGYHKIKKEKKSWNWFCRKKWSSKYEKIISFLYFNQTRRMEFSFDEFIVIRLLKKTKQHERMVCPHWKTNKNISNKINIHRAFQCCSKFFLYFTFLVYYGIVSGHG